MSQNLRSRLGPGPFRADQLSEGTSYELSNGHPILCAPTGARGGRANLVGASVLETDPQVEEAGTDVGYSQAPGDLRAPDIAVGNVPDAPGWVKGVPLLAVEYADVGQDEPELAQKVDELLAGGTRWVWVVRLKGPRRVEVYERGLAMRIVGADGSLGAPGILRNPVSVASLFDRNAAHEAVLRNLLQRSGYETLEEVREEGREEGRETTLRRLIESQLRRDGRTPSDAELARLEGNLGGDELERWLASLIR